MNTINSLMGFSPFQLKMGCSPHIIPPLVLLLAKASKDKKKAHEIISKLQRDIQEAQDNLLTVKI
ncbi:hypothetical protein J132_02860 [Termitomyces sp. J132]|nr:hypothetical protein J132_02860 [Termitomyces sp. J132]